MYLYDIFPSGSDPLLVHSFISELKVNKFSRQAKDKEIFGSIFPCATLGPNKAEGVQEGGITGRKSCSYDKNNNICRRILLTIHNS